MPTTTHYIKVTWTDGATTSYETTGTLAWSTDELQFTTGDGHTHRIRRANTRDIETWDVIS